MKLDEMDAPAATAYARSRYADERIVCTVDPLTGFYTLEHGPWGSTVYRWSWSALFAEADRRERAHAQAALDFYGGGAR